jgi:ligand-binding SRPBCC domain-containing protein
MWDLRLWFFRPLFAAIFLALFQILWKREQSRDGGGSVPARWRSADERNQKKCWRSMVHHAEFAQWVPFPPEQVFLFLANPENLPRIMPPTSRTRIEKLQLVPPEPPPGTSSVATGNSLAGASSEIVTSFRVAPSLPLRRIWIARITEFAWNRHFADIQVRGPFRSWTHRHELTPEVRDGISGTVVRDRVEYEIGFSFLGRIAQTLFVRHQMKETFAYRQAVLEKLLRQS